MPLRSLWQGRVAESGGTLPMELRNFQIDTYNLLTAGKHLLVSVPTGQGKTIMQLNLASLMGGEDDDTIKLSQPQLIMTLQAMLSGWSSHPPR
jgi:superfamily II DNA or RNA helicase